MSLKFYSKEEETIKEKSICDYNKIYNEIFSEYDTAPPPLLESLKEMFRNSFCNEALSNNLANDIINKSRAKYNSIRNTLQSKYPYLSEQEAMILCSYSCEALDNGYSPYKLLNENLVYEFRETGLRKISKYLYIFLNALRKLPRYYPNRNKNPKYLYRCINKKVALNNINLAPNIIPYTQNEVKTFWTFISTSTSTSTVILNNNLGNHPNHQNMKEGTVFSLYGNVWGYDISLFNYHNEEEIILEPERLYLIDEIININDIIIIRCYVEDSPLILADKFIKIKYRINKNDSRLKLFGGYFIQDNRTIIQRIICENEEFPFDNNLMYFDITKYKTKDSIEILLNTNGIMSLSYMFYECYELIELPKKWNISNVKYLDNMFYCCININSLDCISEWDTSNVIDMNYMFHCCSSLTSLPDISNWDTSNVVYMNSMFNCCSSLTSLPDISKWNTSNVTNMCSMFQSCSKLTILPDISQWDVSNVENISFMFKYCTLLEELPDISSWNISKVTNTSFMFYCCEKLSYLPDISIWNASNFIDVSEMFHGCSSLTELPDISKWNVSRVTNIDYMFCECKSLYSLPDIKNKWDISEEIFKNMITGCDHLISS